MLCHRMETKSHTHSIYVTSPTSRMRRIGLTEFDILIINSLIKKKKKTKYLTCFGIAVLETYRNKLITNHLTVAVNNTNLSKICWC